MVKSITYKGKAHVVEIKWAGERYAISVDENAYHTIPFEALKDINLFKKEIIKAIEYVPELALIQDWDGIID